MLVMALLVLGTAIVVFFSQEFADAIKKFFSIPGMKLFIPLIIVSWVYERYEPWVLWCLLYIQKALHRLTHHVAGTLPFPNWAITHAKIVTLVVFAIAPIGLCYTLTRLKGLREPNPAGYLIGIILWMVAAILFVVS